MKWTTHSIFGATLTAWLLFVFKMGVMPVVIMLGALGALFPDIDHPNSKASNANVFTKVFSIFAVISITIFNFVFNAFGGLVSSVTPWKIKNLTSVHRSPITHSLLTVGLFSLVTLPLTFFLPRWWYWGLIAGVLSHVLIDSFNPSGTPLLWPINQNRVRFIPEAVAPTTGTMGEGIVTLLVSALLGVALLLNWSVYKMNISDLEQLFKGAISGISIEKTTTTTTKSVDLSKIDLKALPAGSIRLPDGEIVLPNGKLLSNMSSTEIKDSGISVVELKSMGFTPKEKQQIKDGTNNFIKSTGLDQLFNIFKNSGSSSVPANVVIPGTKPKNSTKSTP